MYFDLVSHKRFTKASRTTGKGGGGCVWMVAIDGGAGWTGECSK